METVAREWLDYIAEHTTSLEEFNADPARYLKIAGRRGCEMTITHDEKPAFVIVDARDHAEWMDRYFDYARRCDALDPKLAAVMDHLPDPQAPNATPSR